LCGGVGGAKLAWGLYQLLGPDRLVLVVNTGDDFTHLGLQISPDLDTVVYTLADVVDPLHGWGRRDETWNFMAELERLGGPTWFRLGDRDIALHVWRSERLGAGTSLSAVTQNNADTLGVKATVLPMSDDPVRTLLQTDEGMLTFQDYFVARKCAPRVRGIAFEGAARARGQPAALAAITSPDTAAVVICPSNPYLSIDPILAVPGMREALQRTHAPVIAVSPLVKGQAVKGPMAKLMREIGLPLRQDTITAHYRGLIDSIVLDEADRSEADQVGIACHVARTIMQTPDDRLRLAREVCDMAGLWCAPSARQRVV
jgi:LPPG:FO 2-phospho-L-lactate transferase